MNKILLMILSILSGGVHALQDDTKQAIEIEADSVVIDKQQGWSLYTGNVKVVRGSLMLSAETIQLFGTQKKITSVIAKGTPNKLAYYTQNQANHPNFIKATALSISYLIQEELIRLKGKVHFVQGTDSLTGATLDYDIKNAKIIAKQSKDGKQQVRFRIKR